MTASPRCLILKQISCAVMAHGTEDLEAMSDVKTHCNTKEEHSITASVIVLNYRGMSLLGRCFCYAVFRRAPAWSSLTTLWRNVTVEYFCYAIF
jgi:hypothetical protein